MLRGLLSCDVARKPPIADPASQFCFSSHCESIGALEQAPSANLQPAALPPACYWAPSAVCSSDQPPVSYPAREMKRGSPEEAGRLSGDAEDLFTQFFSLQDTPSRRQVKALALQASEKGPRRRPRSAAQAGQCPCASKQHPTLSCAALCRRIARRRMSACTSHGCAPMCAASCSARSARRALPHRAQQPCRLARPGPAPAVRASLRPRTRRWRQCSARWRRVRPGCASWVLY